MRERIVKESPYIPTILSAQREKQRYTKADSTLLGREGLIGYADEAGKRSVWLTFDYGQVRVDLLLEKLNCFELLKFHDDLNAIVKDNSKPAESDSKEITPGIGLDHLYKRGGFGIGGRWSSPSNADAQSWAKDISVDTSSSDNAALLGRVVDFIATQFGFPANMVSDIKHEIAEGIAQHCKTLEGLTEQLKTATLETSKLVTDCLSRSGSFYPIVQKWIRHLIEAGDYAGAILWCKTFPEGLQVGYGQAHEKFLLAMRVAAGLLMELKTAISDEKLKEEDCFPLGTDPHFATYLEELFSCTWNIAKYSTDINDRTAASNLLNELLGYTGLIQRDSRSDKLSEVNTFIAYARKSADVVKKARQLEQENKALTERVKALESQLARLNLPAENASASTQPAGQVNPASLFGNAAAVPPAEGSEMGETAQNSLVF